MAIKKNTLPTDIFEVPVVYLRGESKTGKSTLFRDLVQLKSNGQGDIGVIFQMGNESGATMLDGVLVSDPITTWKEFVEHVDMLVDRKTNGLGLENVKVVSFDTFEQMVPFSEKQGIAEGNDDAKRAHMQKRNAGQFVPIRSILSAFGGYGAGKKHVIDNLIGKQIERLNKAGIAVWIIGHSKIKTVSKMDETDKVNFEVLTSNLESTYENVLAGTASATLTVVTSYDQKDYEEEERSGFGATKTIRKAKNFGKLRVYFRATPKIEAGGRFSEGAVPTYLEFDDHHIDAEKFLEVFEEGLRLSQVKNRKELAEKIAREKGLSVTSSGEKTPEPAANDLKPKEPVPETEELEQIEPVLEEVETETYIEDIPVLEDEPENPEDKMELLNQINAQFKQADAKTKNEIKAIVSEYGGLTNCPKETLDKILNLLNGK